MTKTFECQIKIGDLTFDIKYQSQQDKKDDPLGTINIIQLVYLNSYLLSMTDFREKEIYNSIVSFVKQDSYIKWDAEWGKFSNRNKIQND
jgi:hypothetical protein